MYHKNQYSNFNFKCHFHIVCQTIAIAETAALSNNDRLYFIFCCNSVTNIILLDCYILNIEFSLNLENLKSD